jgi:hypothetical protein
MVELYLHFPVCLHGIVRNYYYYYYYYHYYYYYYYYYSSTALCWGLAAFSIS